MSKYQLKIELLSDLCVSDGGVYNSMLDIDVCYDRMGLPYIPSKRLRGCLREAAEELNDWGKNINIDWLFGKAGDHNSSAYGANIRISDAHLVNYDQLRTTIYENQDSVIFHPQNVLNHYSYIRTQTAVNHTTGVADEKSLRTMRVVNKGEIFIADVEIQDDSLKDDFETCCKVMKHMGIARTRGLGEVKLTLNTASMQETGLEKEKIQKVDDADVLEYTFRLLEPVICKSVAGGETKSLDYIDGVKIYGMVAQSIQKEIDEFTKEKQIICSNAYIANGGHRMVEVPATYYAIKNNKKQFVDKSYETEENSENTKEYQLNTMKHCYVDVLSELNNGLMSKSVRMEERYHHRRPDDKSIGRAADDGSGNSMFYQISSIAPNQEFSGYILGVPEQITEIADALAKKKEYRIGYGRSSEYGKIELTSIITSKRETISKNKTKKVLIKLESPTIIYSSHAMYSTNIDDLLAEILAALNIEKTEYKKVESFINYTDVGGFNVTWQKRKPTIECFDKGSVLHIEFSDEIDIAEQDKLFIGERCQEGYGEISVMALEADDERYMMKMADKTNQIIDTKLDVTTSNLAKNISENLFEDYIRMSAIQSARNWLKDGNKKESVLKPLISNMTIMLKDQKNKTLDDIKSDIQKRYAKDDKAKQEKLKFGKEMIKYAKKESEELDSNYADQYLLTHFSYDSNVKDLQYLAAFMNEIKYTFRKEEKGEH